MRKWIILTALLLAASFMEAHAKLHAPFQDGLVYIEWKQSRSHQERQNMLSKLAATGSKHVTLVVFGCQSDLVSSDIGACEVQRTPYVFETLAIARKMGLAVTILPILTTPKWEWRGFFKPANVSSWFANYKIWITSIAKAAQDGGAIELVMASEISGLFQYTEEWTSLANHLRQYFKGNLVIAANWDHFDFDFWPAVDAIGISAYFPIADRDIPSVQEMADKWSIHKKRLLAVSKKYGKPIHLTELGYQSIAGAGKTPWSAPDEAPADFQHQADCFQAFADTWKDEKSLLRASIWATDDVNDQDERSFDVLGKPAQNVLEEFFAHRNALQSSKSSK